METQIFELLCEIAITTVSIVGINAMLKGKRAYMYIYMYKCAKYSRRKKSRPIIFKIIEVFYELFVAINNKIYLFKLAYKFLIIKN